MLSSGHKSSDFIDVKAALARGEDLEKACQAILETLQGVGFDAVGGLTMGADQFAHVLAVLARKQWFVVRKAPKGRGTDKLIEGATLGPGTDALVVEDVVTTGGSLAKACGVVRAAGARVVMAVALVDRGEVANRLFAEQQVPYRPLITYGDLDIAPVGGNDQSGPSLVEG